MSVSYTLRLPDDLKRLIDSAAKSGGVSTAQLVVDACWKYLERGSSVVEQRPHKALEVGSNPIPATIPAVKGNDAMVAFLSKLPVAIPDPPPDPVDDEPKPSCSECDGRMAGKLIKGRGMVYACTDVGCPMYGLERQPK